MSRTTTRPREERRQDSARLNRSRVKGSRVTVVEAKERIAQLIDRVASGRERIVIERDGRVIGALVNRRDLALIVENEEDHEDIAAAEKAAHEEGTVSWEKIKAGADL